MVSHYEDIIDKGNKDTERLVDDYEAQIRELNDRVEKEVKIGEFWIGRFMQLSWLSNNAIADIPFMLRRAEAMSNPLHTPAEIKEFVEYCKNYLEKMKYLAVCRS